MSKVRRETPAWFQTFITEEVSNSTLFKFQVTIDKRQVEIDLRADLGIDTTIIQDELIDNPSVFIFWASIYAELKARCSLVERKIKARRGALADILTKEALQHQVKLTDKQMTTVLEGDEQLNKLEDGLVYAQKHASKVYFMVEAIRMKSDNLRSLAGFAKIDYGNQV